MSKESFTERITKSLISVIIPVYNGEKYISQTIESVLNQPCQSIEILLINDGSKDRSGEICHQFACKYPNVKYFEKENEGIGATRNYGIERAEGEFLNFLDQDDIWNNEFLDKTTVMEIKTGGDVVGFSYYCCNQDDSRRRAVHVKNLSIEGGKMSAVNSSWNHHSSMFFRSEMVKGNKITYPHTRHEDEIFRHKCLYISERVTYIDKMMFVYRNNQNSETHRKQSPDKIYVPLLKSWRELLEWQETRYPEDRESIRFCNSVLCMYIIEGLEAMYRHGMSDKVVERIVQKEGYSEILGQYKDVVDSDRVYSKIQHYYEKHYQFVLKNKLMGCGINVLRVLLRSIWIRKIWDTRKYPIKITD